MVIRFSELFSDLVNQDIPKSMLTSRENRGGYLSRDSAPAIPKEYQEEYIHTPNGFVVNYCEEY